jgi:hypothetical protein
MRNAEGSLKAAVESWGAEVVVVVAGVGVEGGSATAGALDVLDEGAGGAAGVAAVAGAGVDGPAAAFVAGAALGYRSCQRRACLEIRLVISPLRSCTQ